MRPRWPSQVPFLAVVIGLLVSLACAPAAAPTPTPVPAPKPAAPAPTAAPAKAAPAPTTAPAKAAPAAPSKNAQLEALVEGARKEGELTLVYGNILGGPDAIKRWTEGFNKLYGLNLKIAYTPGPPMAQQATSLIQEFQTNRPSQTDILAFAATDALTVMEANAVQSIDWASWAPNVQKAPAVVGPKGMAIEVTTHTPGITYNTNKVSAAEVPKSLQDVLKPQFKGRVASTPYSTILAFMAAPELWGEQRAIEYQKKLADQVAGLIRCTDVQRIASGEFDVFAPDCGTSHHLRQKARGAPVGQAAASDMAITQYFYYLVPKNAPHPNAAKLWADYVMSREAQDILWETDFSDHHLVPGSKSGERIKQIEASGIKFTETSIESVQRNDLKKIEKILGELDAIIQKKR